MKKKEGLNIKKQFKEALNYVGSSKFYIYLIIAIFILSSFVGFFFADRFDPIYDILREIVEKTENMDAFELFAFILQNNFKVSFYSLILGLAFGIYPIIVSISNGIVIGFVLNLVYEQSGLSEIWRLFPHGIFELPAVFISLGLGVKLGFSLFNKNRKKIFKERLYQSINVLLFVVLPLLLIAAFIEAVLIFFFN